MDGSDGGNGKDSGKRRLGLLPEVLPDPQKREGTGSARQRTLKTMERLIAVSAASALIASAEVISGCGYGVVDPMPDPAICEGVAGSIVAKATWKQGPNGFFILLELGKPGRSDASYKAMPVPTVSGGTLQNSAEAMGAYSLELVPDADAGTNVVTVVMPVTCASGDARVYVSVQYGSTPPVDGAVIPVSMFDQ